MGLLIPDELKNQVLDLLEATLAHPILEDDLPLFHRWIGELGFEDQRTFCSALLSKLQELKGPISILTVPQLFPELQKTQSLTKEDKIKFFGFLAKFLSLIAIGCNHAGASQGILPMFRNVKNEMELFGKSFITDDHIKFLETSISTNLATKKPHKAQTPLSKFLTFNFQLNPKDCEIIKQFMRGYFQTGENDIEQLFSRVEKRTTLSLRKGVQEFAYLIGKLAKHQVITNVNYLNICERHILDRNGDNLKGLRSAKYNSLRRSRDEKVDSFIANLPLLTSI